MLGRAWVVGKCGLTPFILSELAIAGGHKPAQNARDMISYELNPEQLEGARKLAKELQEKYGNKSKD